MVGRIVVEVAAGELIDKISILAIKAERISDEDKLAHVLEELDALEAVRERTIPSSDQLDALSGRLRRVNERLWDVEDELRRLEGKSDFGARFIELARSVYRENDERAKLKRAINDLLGSRLVEEKSYAPTAP